MWPRWWSTRGPRSTPPAAGTRNAAAAAEPGSDPERRPLKIRDTSVRFSPPLPRDDLRQRLERDQVVALHELVRVAQRDPHPAREGREAVMALERVHPHEPVRLAGDPPELGVELAQVAALPAVRDDHHGRTAREPAPSPGVVVAPQR